MTAPEFILALALAAALMVLVGLHGWIVRRRKSARPRRSGVIVIDGRTWIISEDDLDAETISALKRELRRAQTEQYL